MKTFEELEEIVRSINEMEEIFRSIVVAACHQKQTQRYLDIRDRVLYLLAKDVQKTCLPARQVNGSPIPEGLCTEEIAECGTCEKCD